jgi:hypothetical protein
MKKFFPLLFFFLCVLVFINSFIEKSNFDFNYTHWLFNYEFEFIKRGLAGEILRIINIPPTQTIVYISSYLIFFSIIFLYVKLFYKPSTENQKNKGIILFFITAALHSATLQHLNYDIGRFDHLSILIFLFLIWILPKLTKPFQVLTVLVSLSISILIHEASFVIAAPVIFAYWVYNERGSVSYNLVRLTVFIFSAALTYYVSLFGLFSGYNFAEYYNYLLAEYGPNIPDHAVLVLFRDLGDNISFTEKKSFSVNHHLLLLLIILPTLVVLGHIFFSSLKKESSSPLNTVIKTIFALSAFTPLVLYPVGLDIFRWWSLAIINLFIVFSVFLREESFRNLLSDFFIRHKRIILFIIVFSIIMGPLGNTLSFSNPRARSLIEFTGFRLFTFLTGCLMIVLLLSSLITWKRVKR